MSRLPEFDLGTLDVAQENIYEGIVSGPRGKFGGPFYALIHAPEIADATQALGAVLRFSGPRLLRMGLPRVRRSSF